MYQIKVTGVTYEINIAGYTKALKAAIEKKVKQGAKIFAFAALDQIPIRTGFVSGAFSNLVDLAGGGARLNPKVAFTQRALRGARQYLRSQPSFGEYYYPPGGGKVLKSALAGRKFATPTQEIIQWEGGSLIFHFDVDISYFRINDSTSRIPSAPWGAMEAGTKAFEEFMEKEGEQIDVKIEDYLILKTI